MTDSPSEKVVTLHPMATSANAFASEDSQRLTEAGGPPHDSDMGNSLAERVASLEGSVRTWGIAITAILAVIFGAGAIVAAVMIFQLEDTKDQVQLAEQRVSERMDRLDARMDGVEAAVRALPAQLTDIATAITNAITASRPQNTAPETPPSK